MHAGVRIIIMATIDSSESLNLFCRRQGVVAFRGDQLKYGMNIIIIMAVETRDLLLRLLPVYEMNATSVKIKVRHDSSIHQGVCTKTCPHLHGHSLQQSKVYYVKVQVSIMPQ